MSPFPIIELQPNELVSEPGFYRIPMEVHHSQFCVGPVVTSGVLRRMELRSPAEVFAFHDLNPHRWPSEDKPALRLGRAIAAYIEGGMEVVAQHFRVVPQGSPRRPTQAQLTAYEEGRASEAAKASIHFWEQIERDGRDLISADDMLTIETMGRVLAADPLAAAVMAGEPEVSMVFHDAATDLWVSARPDTVHFDGSVSDFKRMNTQGRPFDYRVVDQRITQHAYDMQLALAAEAFEALTGEWVTSAGIVAQWDQPPHHVILRGLQEEDLRFGQFRNRRALRRFRECLDADEWPGPGSDVADYQRPEKQRTWLLEQMNLEGTAP